MEKRWTITKHNFEAVRDLAAELGVTPLTAALLIDRGYDNAEKARRFLEPTLDQLHDPFLLKDMDRAVERILSAIDDREKILIWGDYDVDGTTGTALLRRVLNELGGDTAFHIPDRFSEGYGLNIPALEKAVADGCTLCITVDCGIRSFGPLEWAAANGLDVIVTDHHLSDEVCGTPIAYAVVNPNQPHCGYPEKTLAGVGVAFKLAQALLRSRGKEDIVETYLEIAAIGTVADVMRLTGENRVIVARGLRDLTRTRSHGLRALMEIAGCTAEMTSYDIGYRIGPRINAAGRMDVARHVVELLESTDANAAHKLAEMLDTRNRERQRVQQEITEKALFEAAGRGDRMFVVTAGEAWHRGVIGLAASRIAEKLQRPTVVLSISEGVAHGSGRSFAGFHILEALEACSDLFEQFGGHAAAAGMLLSADNVEKLAHRLNAFAAERLTAEQMQPHLKIDALLRSTSISFELLNELSRFEPFGEGNPRPVFATRGLRIMAEPRVLKERHLKFRWIDDDRRTFEAIWWDGVEKSEGRTLNANSSIEIAYTLEANRWNGNVSLQLVVEDMRADNQNR